MSLLKRLGNSEIKLVSLKKNDISIKNNWVTTRKVGSLFKNIINNYLVTKKSRVTLKKKTASQIERLGNN